MKRAALAVLRSAFSGHAPSRLMMFPTTSESEIFLKPEGNRMLILVRIPANAFIDILFPTLPRKRLAGFEADRRLSRGRRKGLGCGSALHRRRRQSSSHA